MIRVRFADATDTDQLVGFIRDHWSSTHIFVDRPDIFTWQHLQADGRLNMVLAEQFDSEDDGVLGVLGFIPLGRFDTALADRDVLLAIWKIRDEGVPPGIGLRLLKFLTKELSPRLIAAIGTSASVRPLYKVLRYEVGMLEQAALFSTTLVDPPQIAGNVPACAFELDGTARQSVELVPIDATAPVGTRHDIDVLAAAHVPEKSWDYLQSRFLDHPAYRYDVRAVRHGGTLVAVVVWRQVMVGEASVLRIVDIVGAVDWLADASASLRFEVKSADAEYIDLLHLGVDADVLRTGGFVSRADFPGMVLPNYFSPFEARNVDIELAYRVTESAEPIRLFRADSDQDRPNMVSELPALD